MRIAAPLFAAFLAAWLGCSAGDHPGGADAGGAARSTDAPRAAVPGFDPDDYQTARVVDLGEGSHAVFGLRIPRGMRPVAGPYKVYRFEGTLDLVAARSFVMRQVETGFLKDEPSGYLIRRARVLDPVGEFDPALRLAVRISRGRKGGATIDVWVERDLERERLRATAGAATGRGGGAAADGAARMEPGGPEARRRAAERRATFEMLEKLGRGEAPSAEDADNPFFQ